LTKLFAKVVPRSPTSALVWGIARIASTVWSSVITTTTFGRTWEAPATPDSLSSASGKSPMASRTTSAIPTVPMRRMVKARWLRPRRRPHSAG
jgi:hypothetical protein